MQDSNSLMPDLAKLNAMERKIIARFIRRERVARDTTLMASSTVGERVADKVASFGGSWSFIMMAVAAIGAWILFNLRRPSFDPYPFILLNLVLSCTAALQAPIIMMSQNRQAARDRVDAKNDYEVNLKAEMEIVALHTKLDEIRERKWADLLEMQQRQLDLLERLTPKPPQ